MRRNVAGQFIGCQLVSKTDGSAVTSGTTTVFVTGDAGTQATGSVGAGAATHEGNGYWTYAPAQAETNYTQVAYTFVNTSAVNSTVQVFTTAYDASGRVDVGAIGGTTQTARDIGASVLLSSGTGTGQLNITSGVVKSNMTQIDGQATNGNNATLNLKKLNIVNNAGDAIVASSTGGNGTGINASGNGSGHGGLYTGGTTGDGVRAVAGGTGGNGATFSASGINADGISASGTRNGLSASGGSGAGISGSGADGIKGTGSTSGILGEGTTISGKGFYGKGLNTLGGYGMYLDGKTNGLLAQGENSGATYRGKLTSNGYGFVTSGEGTGGGYLAFGTPAFEADITGSLSGSVGSVSARINIKKNTLFSGFEFKMYDSTNHLPATGLTVTAQRSIDGAAYAACANAVSEVGSGTYKIDLASTDLNGNCVSFKFTATGADQQDITVVTQE